MELWTASTYDPGTNPTEPPGILVYLVPFEDCRQAALRYLKQRTSRTPKHYKTHVVARNAGAGLWTYALYGPDGDRLALVGIAQTAVR